MRVSWQIKLKQPQRDRQLTHHRESRSQSVPHALDAKLLELGPVRAVRLASLKLLIHHLQFLPDVKVINGEVTDMGQSRCRSVEVSSFTDPSRRFGDKEGTNEEKSSGNKLNSDGDV